MPLAGSVLLGSVLQEFLSTYPEVSVRISSSNAEDLLNNLRVGNVDLVIGLIRDPTPRDLVCEPLVETPYVVVGRHNHPLTKKGRVTSDDLAAYDWVVGTPGASRRVCFDNMFAKRKKPRAAIETSSSAILHTLINQSDRLTLLTTYELRCESNWF